MARVACLGMTVHDRILSVPVLPTKAMKIYATATEEAGGGNSATGAVAIVALGGEALLFGRVGEDDVGRTIRAELTRYGVDVTGVKALADAETGWSAVAIDPTGDRLILAFPGRNLQVVPDWLDEARIAQCGAVEVDMGWPAGAALMLAIANKHGIPSVIDADFGPLAEAGSLIAQARHVVFSEAGLRQQSGQETAEDGLRTMRARLTGAAAVGVTLGPGGYLWLEDVDLHHLATPKVTVVDTLGAGDVFHGAYALALAEGAAVAQAARFAVAAATLKCTRPGGRKGVASRAEVEAVLRQAW